MNRHVPTREELLRLIREYQPVDINALDPVMLWFICRFVVSIERQTGCDWTPLHKLEANNVSYHAVKEKTHYVNKLHANRQISKSACDHELLTEVGVEN